MSVSLLFSFQIQILFANWEIWVQISILCVVNANQVNRIMSIVHIINMSVTQKKQRKIKTIKVKLRIFWNI